MTLHDLPARRRRWRPADKSSSARSPFFAQKWLPNAEAMGVRGRRTILFIGCCAHRSDQLRSAVHPLPDSARNVHPDHLPRMYSQYPPRPARRLRWEHLRRRKRLDCTSRLRSTRTCIARVPEVIDFLFDIAPAQVCGRRRLARVHLQPLPRAVCRAAEAWKRLGRSALAGRSVLWRKSMVADDAHG